MPGFDPSVSPDPASAAFAFVAGRMLVRAVPEVRRVPMLKEVCGPIAAGPFPMGAAVAVSLSGPGDCAGMELMGLRELFGVLTEEEMELAARAFQILEWSSAHAFCGRCGGATVYSTSELARTCPSCGAMYFPRITPAVITLVRRGDEILLARGQRFGPRFYSLIAGFVEPGETLEQAVAREVREEVGIEVKNIAYFASQSWPFPSQLMVGFTAEHASGEIQVNHAELSDARWFRIDQPPGDIDLPTNFSISGRIIRSALASR